MTGTACAALTAGALILSISSGHGGGKMRLPSFRGICEIRSCLPGRLRLYMPAIIHSPDLAREAVTQLRGTGVLRQCELNERIGTLLLVYDESQVEAAVLQGAVIRLMGLS